MVCSSSLYQSSYSIKSMTASSLWTLQTNIYLSEGELEVLTHLKCKAHTYFTKGLLCILIFYAFYSSKREEKQVEVIEVARCWWHPFHCNDSHDLRFCLTLLFPWIANPPLPQQLYTLKVSFRKHPGQVIVPILFALHQSTPNSLLQGSTGVVPRAQLFQSTGQSQPLIIPASWADIPRWGNDILNEQSWLPGKAILQDSTANSSICDPYTHCHAQHWRNPANHAGPVCRTPRVLMGSDEHRTSFHLFHPWGNWCVSR